MGDAAAEALVARTHAPALWNRGLDALEHLPASEYLARPEARSAC